MDLHTTSWPRASTFYISPRRPFSYSSIESGLIKLVSDFSKFSLILYWHPACLPSSFVSWQHSTSVSTSAMKLSLSLFLGLAIFSTHVLACASPGDHCVLGDPVQCECNGGHLVSLARNIYAISYLILESAIFLPKLIHWLFLYLAFSSLLIIRLLCLLTSRLCRWIVWNSGDVGDPGF